MTFYLSHIREEFDSNLGLGFVIFDSFLGTFAKLRKVIISFMSVRPPAGNDSVPTGRIFMKFNI